MCFWFRWSLSAADRSLLEALAAGSTLKSHRNIEGEKVYRLYSPQGEAEEIPFHQVQQLLERKLITTNQKFPAATFLLTSKGQQLIAGRQGILKGLAAIVKFDT